MNKQISTNTIIILTAYLSIIFILIVSFFTITAILNSQSNQKKVKGVVTDNDNISISAAIYPDTLLFTVYPEKRAPTTNNWDTILDFEILDCSTYATLHSFSTITTNNAGEGTIDLSSISLAPDSYAFRIKAYSHTSKRMNCYSLTDMSPTISIDFTLEGDLFAGDTSVISDNYINSLDISNMINNLYQTDYKTDLNQDSKINSLDYSNLLYNLYVSGD